MSKGQHIPVHTKNLKRGIRTGFEEEMNTARPLKKARREEPAAGKLVKKSIARRYAEPVRRKDRSDGKRFTFKEHEERRNLRKGGKPSRNAYKSLQRCVCVIPICGTTKCDLPPPSFSCQIDFVLVGKIREQAERRRRDKLASLFIQSTRLGFQCFYVSFLCCPLVDVYCFHIVYFFLFMFS